MKNILQLLTGLQFDICYVIKTRVGFEITRFLNCFSSYSFALRKLSENPQEHVYSEVICSKNFLNVRLLMSNRDLPLKNSAIMVKWKCLKLLHLSKGMCRIDSQLKKLIRLKYLIVETPYTFFSIFSWYFIVFHS